MSAPPTIAPSPRAPAPAPAAPIQDPRPGQQRAAAAATRALLPAPAARLIGFVALAGFGALQWAGMVRPEASDPLLGSVLAAALGGYALSAVARRRPHARVRLAATILVAVVLLLIALAVSGVPARLFAPRGWDDLVGGIGQGLGAVSTVRTPYSGLDEWTRIVLILGGCALSAAAALLAFLPRRNGAFGFPTAAAVALGLLYTVPVMQHDIERPWLGGLVFTLLLACFLWLERIERRGARLAAAIVAAAGLGGYVVAPALDRDRALLDYEEIAQSLSPSATTQYRWNHSYGALDWPRDGREVLRVRAKQRSYWKAVNLVAFDGERWVQDANQGEDPLETTIFERQWVQKIRVTMRALRTSQFIGAGTTLDILDSPRTATSNTPGLYESAGAPLRRGHAYEAVVYAPRPTNAQLRAASIGFRVDLPRGYGVARLPVAKTGGTLPVAFPWWGERQVPRVIGSDATDARALLAATAYGPVYELARRLRAGAATPLDYVRAVERHLQRGFRYTETPPPSRAPIADFLLRDKAGYCQQFSGAMALLLRMGGVPSRVASGFSPGSLDIERNEYVVRDVDAHSWVEVFMPGIGWVTRDPTPADSPARTQSADLTAGAREETVTFGGSERALDRSLDTGGAGGQATPSASEGGPSALAMIGGVVFALLAIIAAIALVRRRRRATGRSVADEADASLAELLRALHRTHREPPPQLTLDALAGRLAGTPAQDYVRTLASARYGYGSARPTRVQRAALRRELGAGLGPRGRLRAWWALPPKLSRRPSA